jgi:hypothetical protein
VGYNLELRTEKIAGQANIFDSALVRWITGGVTIDAATVSADADGNKILKAGTPLGRITASGKYGPYAPAVAGVAASGTTTVDGVKVTIEGDTSAVYNGVVISFADGAEEGAAAAAWSDGTLTVTLEDDVDYAQDDINTLIAAATTGAPTGVDPTKIIIKTTVEKTGAQWGAANDVVLAGGADAIAAANDGRQTAVLMIAEDVDCTEGDMVVTAFDQARVIVERLPVEVTSELKAQLNNITFVSRG